MLEILVTAPDMREVIVGVGHARNPGHGTRNERRLLSEWAMLEILVTAPEMREVFFYFGFTHW